MDVEFKLVDVTNNVKYGAIEDELQLHVMFSHEGKTERTIFRDGDSVSDIFHQAKRFQINAINKTEKFGEASERGYDIKPSEFTDKQKEETLLRHNWFYWKEQNAYMQKNDMAKGFSLEEAFKIQLEHNRKARLNQIFGNNFKKIVAEYPLTPEEAFGNLKSEGAKAHYLSEKGVEPEDTEARKYAKSDNDLSLMELYEKYINPKPDGAEIHWFHQMFDIGIYVPKNETIDGGQTYFDATEEHQKEKYRKARAWIMYNRKLKNNMENKKSAEDYGHFEKSLKKDYTLKELEQLTTDELFCLIEQWGIDRNFYGEGGATPLGQFAKLISEAGELADNLARGKDVRDDIGDMAVVMVAIARLKEISMQECLAQAYFDIKDRKGTWVNGTFVKESK